MASLLALTALVAAGAQAQQVGTNTAEVHPALPMQQCTAAGCTTESTSVVLDANWRWVHTTSGYTNCYTGNAWDPTICADPTSCAANCALDGADYAGTYGIKASGDAVTLDFVTNGGQSSSPNVGSRIYLLGASNEYQIFKLLNQEFTFDVDVSNLPCGINGALYFTEMDADGGMAKYPTNKAGATYGTGYCDAQCPQDLKFIDGAANSGNWTPSATDPNSGKGAYGSCCNEMDIWEANSQAAAFTPHPCSVAGQTRCTGASCGAGTGNRYNSLCDADGCDFNSWRMGNETFLGPQKTVDTTQKFTVVTQFVTDSGTAAGNLQEIRRLYVQNGKVFQNSAVNIPGIDPVNSITDNFCAQQKTVFANTNEFATKGGMAGMGKALAQGMVLTMSIWDDQEAYCLWLDSDYPTTADPSTPGVSRGPCGTNTGVPAQIEKASPGASVTFSNIRLGDFGSTYSGTPGTGSGGSGGGGGGASSSSTTTAKPTTTTAAPSKSSSSPPATSPTSGSGGAAHYGQCGGIGWKGPTTCVAPFTCQFGNPYYSQCL